jgi:GLPGLI family protein
MKKITLLLALFVVATTTAFAQLTEGHVSYEITVSSDDPEMAMAIMMFEGSTMDLYFSGDLARTELDFGALISMTTVANNKTGEVVILMGGMMGNRGVLTTQSEMKDDSGETPETKVELVKGKKKIQGYKCKKAIITDDAGNQMVYWYTKAIKSQNPDVNSPSNKVPGFPMEFESNRDGMMMTFVATSVTKSLTESEKTEKLSLTIPEGYEEMTYEEFSNFGGM